MNATKSTMDLAIESASKAKALKEFDATILPALRALFPAKAWQGCDHHYPLVLAKDSGNGEFVGEYGQVDVKSADGTALHSLIGNLFGGGGETAELAKVSMWPSKFIRRARTHYVEWRSKELSAAAVSRGEVWS